MGAKQRTIWDRLVTPQDREYDLSLGSGASPKKPEQVWTGPGSQSFFGYSGMSADAPCRPTSDLGRSGKRTSHTEIARALSTISGSKRSFPIWSPVHCGYIRSLLPVVIDGSKIDVPPRRSPRDEAITSMRGPHFHTMRKRVTVFVRLQPNAAGIHDQTAVIESHQPLQMRVPTEN